MSFKEVNQANISLLLFQLTTHKPNPTRDSFLCSLLVFNSIQKSKLSFVDTPLLILQFNRTQMQLFSPLQLPKIAQVKLCLPQLSRSYACHNLAAACCSLSCQRKSEVFSHKNEIVVLNLYGKNYMFLGEKVPQGITC